MFLPHPRVNVSIVGSLRDREVACSASDRQGSNFESCVWRTVSSQSSHHPQEVLLAQFSLYVHKGGLKPDSFHFFSPAKFDRAIKILIIVKRNFAVCVFIVKMYTCTFYRPTITTIQIRRLDLDWIKFWFVKMRICTKLETSTQRYGPTNAKFLRNFLEMVT